ncbi:MAG: hypothetical protein R2911_43620 [Caldilineaceae bacterium]
MSAVDEAEWTAIQTRLRASYERVTASINGIETWSSEWKSAVPSPSLPTPPITWARFARRCTIKK